MLPSHYLATFCHPRSPVFVLFCCRAPPGMAATTMAAAAAAAVVVVASPGGVAAGELHWEHSFGGFCGDCRELQYVCRHALSCKFLEVASTKGERHTRAAHTGRVPRWWTGCPALLAPCQLVWSRLGQPGLTPRCCMSCVQARRR
jgi:hypothetical protein